MSKQACGACPDCPAVLGGSLLALVEGAPSRCEFRCVQVPARTFLPSTSSPADSVALVRRGIVMRQRIDATGEGAAFDVAGAGAMLPLSESVAVLALTDALLCICPGQSLGATIQARHNAALDLVRAQSQVLERVARLADARGRRTATGKVATLLCALADTLSPYGESEIVPAGVQQRDLGALLSIRHESVCRVVQGLVKRGAVGRVTGGLRIVDRPKLELCA